MIYYETKLAAEEAAGKNNHLIGHKMPPPYSALLITSITVEKAEKHKGFIVMLSHDIYDNGWPEIAGFFCPQVQLDDYITETASIPN